MKPLCSQRLLTLDSEAPALTRGFALWMLLLEVSPLTLEEIASRSGLPKASTLRLLEGLCRMGVIRRGGDKRFEPLCTLQSLTDPVQLLRGRIGERLKALCGTTGCTAEWYEPAADGMVLMLQELPDGEVAVRARPGYLRSWDGELEAVTVLGLAFCSGGASLTKGMRYVRDGVLERLSRDEVRALMAGALESRAVWDEAFNRNGVRRCAVALVDEGRLLGVLSLADFFRFGSRPAPERWVETLKELLYL